MDPIVSDPDFLVVKVLMNQCQADFHDGENFQKENSVQLIKRDVEPETGVDQNIGT